LEWKLMADEYNPFEGMPQPGEIRPSFDGADFELIRKAEAVAADRAKRPPEGPQTWTEQAADIGGAGAAGVGRGIVSLPGMVGDVAQLAKRSPAYAEWAYNRAKEAAGYAPEGAGMTAYRERIKPIEEAMSPEERAGMAGSIMGVPFPTGQRFIKGAQEYVPQLGYEGQSPAARVVGTVGEFVGATPGLSAVSGGIRGAVKGGTAFERAANAAKGAKTAAAEGSQYAVQGGAGAASGTAGEMAKGTEDETFWRTMAAFPGALSGKAAYSRFAPGQAAERGQRLAGDITRATEPGIGGTPILPSDAFSADVKPTLGQATGSARLTALEKAVNPQGSQSQRNANTIAMQKAVGELPDIIEQGGNIVGNPKIGPGMLALEASPLAVSSADAQKLYSAVREPMQAAFEKAYEHPAFEQARYSRPAVKTAIDAAYKDMGIKSATMPVELRKLITGLKNWPTSQVPFQEIQDVKSYANKMLRDPKMDKRVATAITTKLDDLLTDQSKVSQIFMKGVTPGEVPGAFDKARTLYKNYKRTFETPTTAELSELHPEGHPLAGKPVIEAENFLDRVLGGQKDALSKYRELQSISGMDVSRPVSDWLVGKIQGDKPFITPEMVDKFAKSPSYATLIQEVPGLEKRLELISRTGAGDQVLQSLKNNMAQSSPEKLSAWMNKNRSAIDEHVVTPEGRAFVDKLGNSANTLSKLTTTENIPANAAKKLELLQNGDLFTLLHGRAVGAIGGAAAGYGAGKLASLGFPGVSNILPLETLGAAMGVTGSGIKTPATRALSRVIYGTTAEDAMSALQRASVDPAFAQFLAQKPSMENALKLQGLLKSTKYAPQATFMGQKTPTEAPEPEKTTEQLYEELQNRPNELTIKGPGNREGRATGGAVNLMALSKAAKKHVTQSTEGLLNESDDTVAHALEIANKHI
jgi:hypothetical protein